MLSHEQACLAVKLENAKQLKRYIKQQRSIATENDDNEPDVSLSEALSQPDDSGKQTTLLHWAAYVGNGEIIDMLVAAGAKKDSTEVDGKTPLHWACFEGHGGVVSQLLGLGCNFALKDLSGATPCHLALRGRHFTVAELLPNYHDLMLGSRNVHSPGPAPLPTPASAKREYPTPEKEAVRDPEEAPTMETLEDHKPQLPEPSPQTPDAKEHDREVATAPVCEPVVNLGSRKTQQLVATASTPDDKAPPCVEDDEVENETVPTGSDPSPVETPPTPSEEKNKRLRQQLQEKLRRKQEKKARKSAQSADNSVNISHTTASPTEQTPRDPIDLDETVEPREENDEVHSQRQPSSRSNPPPVHSRNMNAPASSTPRTTTGEAAPIDDSAMYSNERARRKEEKRARKEAKKQLLLEQLLQMAKGGAVSSEDAATFLYQEMEANNDMHPEEFNRDTTGESYNTEQNGVVHHHHHEDPQQPGWNGSLNVSQATGPNSLVQSYVYEQQHQAHAADEYGIENDTRFLHPDYSQQQQDNRSGLRRIPLRIPSTRFPPDTPLYEPRSRSARSMSQHRSREGSYDPEFTQEDEALWMQQRRPQWKPPSAVRIEAVGTPRTPRRAGQNASQKTSLNQSKLNLRSY